MKLPTIAPTVTVPDQYPTPQASPAAFGAGYGAAAAGLQQVSQGAGQLAQNIQKHEQVLADAAAKQQHASDQISADQAVNGLKDAYDAGAEEIKAAGDPSTYHKQTGELFDTITQNAQADLSAGAKQEFQRKIPGLRAESSIKARTEGIRMQHAVNNASAALLDREDANTVVFGADKYEREQALKNLVERDKMLVATGTRATSSMTQHLAQIEEAQVLRDGMDPTKLPGVIAGLQTGQYPSLTTVKGMELVEKLQNRMDKQSTIDDKAFKQNSELLRKEYEAQIRLADSTGDFQDIERKILTNRGNFTRTDMTEMLTHVDTQRKARATGESDQGVLTTVEQRIDLPKSDPNKITRLSQLNQYAGSLAPHDIRSLSDKIATNREKVENKAETDQQRRVSNAREAGEKYIRDVTTISSNLLAFDQLAKQVQGQLAFSFATETNGLEDVGAINTLARQRGVEARAVLADKLTLEGQKLYPLTQYKTREEIAQAYQQGKFGAVGSPEARTKADNMINLVDYITKLVGAQETQGGKDVTSQATEAAGKRGATDTRKLYEKVLPSAVGGKPAPTKPTEQDMAGPVRQAAEELYPGVPMMEISRDEEKVKKITERAIKALRDKGGK